MKAKNMISSKGNKVPNQFIIENDTFIYFQSYKSMICKINKKTKKVYLDKVYWDYSRTTLKYLNLFLFDQLHEDITKRNIEGRIKIKEYTLTDLNK